MNNVDKDIQNLKSIRFRNPGYKRKRILKPAQEIALRQFLFSSINENVFVISTGLGMDVYYISDKDYSDFIEKNLYLFHPEEVNKEILIEEKHAGVEVLQYFQVVVHTLTSHPQLLYSCIKKILSQFNELGVRSKLDRLLFQCLDDYIEKLAQEECLPFNRKINRLRQEIDNNLPLADATTSTLIQTYLNANHLN